MSTPTHCNCADPENCTQPLETKICRRIEAMSTPASKSLQRAAQAWCAATTSHKEMDAALATEFARILDADHAAALEENAKLQEFVSQPHLRYEYEAFCADCRAMGTNSGVD